MAFTITISGGATQLSYEGRFSDLAGEMNSDASAASVEEIVERLRRHKAKDYDFRPHFAAQKCPGLWLYGAMDRSNPSQLCVEMLEQIKQRTGNDFTIKLYPGANHGLWECRYGGAAEYATLSNVVPELHRTIADWLQQKGFGPERTN